MNAHQDRPACLFVIWSCKAYAGMERALVMAANVLSGDHDVEIVVVRPPPVPVQELIRHDLAPNVKLIIGSSLRDARRRVRGARRPVLVGLWTVARSRSLGPRAHDWVWWEHSVTTDRLRLSRRLRILHRLAALSTDPRMVVVPAAFMQPETEQRSRRPVKVIPNGGVALPNGSRASARRKRDHPVVGTIGRLESSRRTDLALRSLAHLDAVVLHVAGDGPERLPLEELSRALGLEKRVVFHGWVTDKAEFFAAIDLLVVTSPSETFGYALFEAAEHAVPVVACPNPRTSEVIPRLVPGALAHGADEVHLAAAITEALGRSRQAVDLESAAQLRNAELSDDVVRQRWCDVLDADDG